MTASCLQDCPDELRGVYAIRVHRRREQRVMEEQANAAALPFRCRVAGAEVIEHCP